MDVAMHRNGSDGNLSPVEEDEMHCSDGYNSEDEVASQPMAASQVTSGQFQDLFARLKAQQAVAAATVAAGDTKTELDEELDDLKQEERENRETNAVLLAMQRHAVQMAAAAAAGSAAGIPNFANLAALGGFGGQLNAMSLFANGAFAANANLSPPLGAVASQASSANQMTPSSCANGATPGNQATTLSSIEAGKGYTFEEQFKQLYEISEDPKRKQFLDELFMFMQKRGTPINRIPIMAKQVLDLYELYNLVVARGGLVEVINKKIWREITKGLNLPSSITSAAFTLRTQYMKYLYPYECEKENLSSTDELQMAIDGNRREGRRPSYGQYPEMGGSPPPVAAILGNGPNAHPAPGLGSMDLFGRAGLDLSSTLSLMSRQLNGVAHHHQNNVAHSTSSGDEDRDCSISPPPSHTPHKNELRSPLQNENVKRFKKDESSPSSGFGFPGMNMKISSKDGRPLDGQITMSIEVNGVLYNGILFAQPQNSSQ